MPTRFNPAPLLAPNSVAVIGASATPGKIGRAILENLVNAGYPGSVFPVNPKGGTLLGLPVYARIDDLPGPLDLAVLAVPPEACLEALTKLAALPTRAVIVVAAGFRETGPEGRRLEAQLAALARERGIALLGPNCLGVVNPHAKLNVTFGVSAPKPGAIGFFSQSGALCAAVLDWADGAAAGFSAFVSLGNKAVLDESDLLPALAADPNTKVILGYLESVEKGPAFMAAAAKATRKKPVVVLKAGATPAGARAAGSHTGAIAGADQAYQAAFKQSGVIRAEGMAELFNLALAFSTQPLPQGRNLAVVTNSGGPGILAADAAERAGLILVRPGLKTVTRLKKLLPPFAALYNPVDVIGDADAARLVAAVEIVARDPLVHSLLVMATPTAALSAPDLAERLIAASTTLKKPLAVVLMGEKSTREARQRLLEAGTPCHAFPEPAAAAISTMTAYAEHRRAPKPAPICARRDLAAAKAVVDRARDEGLTELVEFQARDLAKAYFLDVPAARLARTSDEAARIAAEIGFPVVVKIASPDISHKSDLGGVVVNLTDEAAVRKAFRDVTARIQRLKKDAFISGCLVQRMAPKGAKECIVGFARDPQFGPLVMFGLGGIYVEVLKDVSFRLAPLTVDDARAMLREIRAHPLLRGVRGEAAVNFRALEDVVLALSQMALDFPEILEAEVNPVFADARGALVADARVVLAP